MSFAQRTVTQFPLDSKRNSFSDDFEQAVPFSPAGDSREYLALLVAGQGGNTDSSSIKSPSCQTTGTADQY